MHTTSAAQCSTIIVKEGINAAGPLRKAVVRHSKFQDRGVLVREDFDGGPVSFDEIECGLFLGNITAATNMEALKNSNITYILTLDSVPLPKHITEASFLTTKYIHIADIPKEDILHHLDSCIEFIKTALSLGNKILVHCYFGVSRSSSVVIAYLMKTYNLDYQQAFEMVKSKRRFVQPNVGFVAQLKLWHRMGYTIEPHCQKYKIYRLRLAGEQVRKAKILPQNFSNLIKADPAITQAKPEPIVYRCRKCRRILASKSHLLQHMVKNDNLRTAMAINDSHTNQNPNQTQQSSTSAKLLLDIAAQLRNVSIVPSTTNTHLNNLVAVGQQQPEQQQQSIVQSKYCESIIFVEPIAWMKHITHSTQGRLNCPKCEQKLGNFSWINGCQCPCGEEVSPAFYLIPSKVELSKAVQNVQTTL